MSSNDNRNLLWQYAGLAMQLAVALVLAVYAGLWIDKKIALSFPLAVWILPLLVIIGMIVKAIKDTSVNK